MNAIDEVVVRQLGWTLVHTLWQGVVFAALLAAALRVMRGAAATTRYAAACAAMVLTVLAAVGTFAVQRSTSASSRVESIPSRVVDSTTFPVTAAAVPPRVSEVPRHWTEADVLRSVVLGWAVGVALMSLWHAGGWLWLQRQRRGAGVAGLQPTLERLALRMGVGAIVRVAETACVDVPAVVGALRPVILVPIGILNDLSAAQVEAILAHELAHVRRHDYLVNLVQAAVESLMFYHPAVWWMSAQIRVERENCCDDLAIAATGDRRAYAAALASLEERVGLAATRRRLAPAIDGGSGRLVDRVRRLLRLPPARRKVGRVRSLAAAALAVACVAVPMLVAAQEKAQENKSAAQPTTAPVATTAPADDLATSPIRPDDMEVNAQDYRIAAGDLVSVSIQGLVGPGVETVKQARVSETGKISAPLVGEIALAGSTAPQAEAVIAKAYRDANLLANAQVSVTVAEARANTFSMLGKVDRPGQYAIANPDFRVLDALAVAGGRPAEIGELRLIRKEGEKKRVLEIAIDQLARGVLRTNVVIRAGDMLIAAPREKEFVRVAVAKDGLLKDGQLIDVAALKKLLADIPPSRRRNTVLEVSAASPDVTVERFFTATAALSQLVQEQGLANLSQTGIQAPTTKPATTPAAEHVPASEYYIEGVRRAGVYNPGRRAVTLKQAIAAAGGPDVPPGDAFVSVLRRQGDVETYAMENVRLSAVVEGDAGSFAVRGDDVIRVTSKPIEVRAAQNAPAIRPADPQAKKSGEYFINGLVPRTGVYSITGRKITLKQAIAAAGGLEGGVADAFVSVARRTPGKDGYYPVANVRVSELLSGAQPDAYLQPDDVVQVNDKPMNAPATAPAAAAPAARLSAGPEVEAVLNARLAESLRLAELQNRYGPQHPAVRSARAKLDEFNRRLSDFAELPVKQIAGLDPTMHEYLKALEAMESNLKRLEGRMGSQSRVVLDAKADVAIQQQRIDAYAADWRQRLTATTQR